VFEQQTAVDGHDDRILPEQKNAADDDRFDAANSAAMDRRGKSAGCHSLALSLFE
jgi:hypothetical protein